MAPTWHLIEGEAGCAYAKEHGCIAVVVDALRASTTAAMLLDAGATELCVVETIEEALRAKSARPEALLFGERDGVPPAGFDHGNSPREAPAAAGRPVIFTTTTGSQRLIQAYGAPEVYMASTVNAFALALDIADAAHDIVLIPAGNALDPEFDCQEDWVAAAAIAMLADATVGEGALLYRDRRQWIELDGVPKLFEAAPHAAILRGIGLGDDVAFCAQSNITTALPKAIGRDDHGVLVRNANA